MRRLYSSEAWCTALSQAADSALEGDKHQYLKKTHKLIIKTLNITKQTKSLNLSYLQNYMYNQEYMYFVCNVILVYIINITLGTISLKSSRPLFQ